MRRGLKGVSSEEAEKRINTVMKLFSCLHGRDMFMKAYETELAQRLLNKTSVSMEHEELVLQKLKIEVGQQEVKKICLLYTSPSPRDRG